MSPSARWSICGAAPVASTSSPPKSSWTKCAPASKPKEKPAKLDCKGADKAKCAKESFLQDYKAAVVLRIEKQYSEIPDDSDASINTAGLLGGKYIGIGPGGSETFLKDGGQIEFTQSAIVLESLVNKFFANMASKGSDDSKPATPDAGAKQEQK